MLPQGSVLSIAPWFGNVRVSGVDWTGNSSVAGFSTHYNLSSDASWIIGGSSASEYTTAFVSCAGCGTASCRYAACGFASAAWRLMFVPSNSDRDTVAIAVFGATAAAAAGAVLDRMCSTPS